MRPFLLLFGAIVSAIMIYALEIETKLDTAKREATEYKWQNVVPSGNGQFEEKWIEGMWPMGLMPVVAFDDKLWMIGRHKSWSSANGVDWISHQKTTWEERHGMAFVFFKNKIWMMGGMKNWGDFRNDIWNSADGKNWERVVESAPWSRRVRPKLAVFDNKLWLLGGTVSSLNPDKLPSHFLNDVWSSVDGINWKLELKSAPWPVRHDPKVVVYNGKLWIIGGTDRVDDGGRNDVWNSSDGQNWKLVSSNSPWSGRRNNGVQIFDDQLWVFGGVGKNDVWHSSDGTTWNKLQSSPWSTRTTENSIVFRNKLWIFSGKTGREDSWDGAIWTLVKQ